MRKVHLPGFRFHAVLFLVVLLCSVARSSTIRGALTTGVTVIEHVTIIPMAGEKAIPDGVVVVRDGRIEEVGPFAATPRPVRAKRVDGRGKFLIPGLSDMHVHLFADEDPKLEPYSADELGVMLANGVTSIRLMIGTPHHLKLRREIAEGRMLGPQLWVASPQFTGRPGSNASVVKTPEEAAAAVKTAADAGYDFIKLTTAITPEVFDATVREAARNGIRVIGHVDPRVGVKRALEAGQHIEHLDSYLESVIADGAPTKDSVSDIGVFFPKRWEGIDHIDDKKVDQIAEETVRARVFTTPTLTLFKKAFTGGQSDEEIRARPDWKLQPAAHREMYLRGHQRYWSNPPSEVRRKRYVEVKNRIVKGISDRGGKIMAGSDTPEWFLGYGYTLHRELESLVAAGLTPYQALTAATRTPAEFFHSLSEFGTIEAGKRADLVLLSANPLDDIRNTTKIEAVCVGGKWLEKKELAEMVARAEKALGADSERKSLGAEVSRTLTRSGLSITVK